jgi:glycosyltransferase involved in cell wall biosynthesis
MTGERPRRLKVCHVVATTDGAPWVAEQLRDLRERYGFEVAAVVPAPGGPLVDRLRSERIAVHVRDLAFTGRKAPWRLLAVIFGLARLLRQERFDVVHTHLFSSMVIGRIAGWLADVPVRVSMIAGPFHLEARASRWVDRATWWMDSVLVGSCVHTVGIYRGLGIPADRLALVYYGADDKRFDPRRVRPANLRAELGWSPGTPVVGMIAYFYAPLPTSRWAPPAVWGHGLKGQEFLIRAVPLVLRRFPGARFLLVGSGWNAAGREYLDDMKLLARRLGVQDSIVFAGFRPDVESILADLDVSVQPSLSENLGGTIESLLMECPTVASDVGGMPDSVRDGITGILVRPADPADLADGIVRLLRDRARAYRLGRAGRALMLERFTLERTVADLNAVYARLGVGRPGYRALVSARRLIVAVPLGVYLVLRLVIVEYGLFPYRAAGRRRRVRPPRAGALLFRMCRRLRV